MKLNEILSIMHDSRILTEDGEFGELRELLNLPKEKIIFKYYSVEKTSNKRIYCGPYFSFIDDKKLIVSKLKKIDFEKINNYNEECEEHTNYYRIIDIHGFSVSFKSENIEEDLRKKIDDLLDISIKNEKNVEEYIEKSPLLNYTESNIVDKIDFLQKIEPYIEHNDISEFLKYVDENCIYNNLKEEEIKGKKNIKKHLKKLIGFHNSKIKYDTWVDYYGYLNKQKESDILLKVTYYLKKANNRIENLVIFKIDNNLITDITIFSEKSLNYFKYRVKRIDKEILNLVKYKIYNDFDESTSNIIKRYLMVYKENHNPLYGPFGTKEKFIENMFKEKK